MKTKIQSRLMVVVLSFLVCLAFVPMAAFAVEDNPEPATDPTVEEPAQVTGEETEEPDVGDQKDEENPAGDQVDPTNPGGDPTNPDNGAQVDPENQVFAITYNPDGGKWEGTSGLTVIHKKAGEKIVLMAAPKKEGYTFLGWDENLLKAESEYTVTADHTFKAMWKKNDTTPKTGDNAMPYVYALGLLTAASAMFVLRAKKAK